MMVLEEHVTSSSCACASSFRKPAIINTQCGGYLREREREGGEREGGGRERERERKGGWERERDYTEREEKNNVCCCCKI